MKSNISLDIFMNLHLPALHRLPAAVSGILYLFSKCYPLSVKRRNFLGQFQIRNKCNPLYSEENAVKYNE